MSAVMNPIGVAFAYAVLALFAQNAIFTRGLGVSRLIQLVGDERTSSWWFALLLCVTQTLVAPLAYFAGIVPHGIFELPALILALSSGIYLCRKVTDYVRHNEKGVMGPLMKDLLRLFVMHIIPLLVAAAMMEAYVTPQLLKLFL